MTRDEAEKMAARIGAKFSPHFTASCETTTSGDYKVVLWHVEPGHAARPYFDYRATTLEEQEERSNQTKCQGCGEPLGPFVWDWVDRVERRARMIIEAELGVRVADECDRQRERDVTTKALANIEKELSIPPELRARALAIIEKELGSRPER